jgi:hypothetical protein
MFNSEPMTEPDELLDADPVLLDVEPLLSSALTLELDEEPDELSLLLW